ncbi:hypothetical protein [Flavobacterium subsaxonicum]|nr:hypothetical protein [Flavobacterium subsaxonicum]
MEAGFSHEFTNLYLSTLALQTRLTFFDSKKETGLSPVEYRKQF